MFLYTAILFKVMQDFKYQSWACHLLAHWHMELEKRFRLQGLGGTLRLDNSMRRLP